MKLPETQTDLENNISQPLSQPPYNSQRWLRLLLGILLFIGGITTVILYLWTSHQPSPSASNAPPPVKVKLSPVQTGTIEDSSEYIATLESRRSVNLQPRIQGQVTQIFVRSGDVVASGAAIMQVDAREQQAAVSSLYAAGQASQAQLENVRATLKSLKAQRLANVADLHLNEQDYRRYSTLAAQGAVPLQTKDQYANKLSVAKAQLGAIDSQIRAQQATISQSEKFLNQADANIRQQQVQLQYYKILAPFSGTIGDVPVKVGDFVTTSTPLATLTQNRPLEVRISVPLERGPELHQGLAVSLMNAQGQSLGNSEIFFISPNITNTSQSILIKALYNNADGQLRANQLIRARVIWSQRRGVLIPTTSVSHIAGATFVFVAETEKSPRGVSQLVARQKLVKLGTIKGNNYQVIAGLKPDEPIIISGLLNLRDGLSIIPESQ